MQEVSGSTVRLSSIRYATNGIEVLGMPTHSPLLIDMAETPADNDTFANAQYIGNLLDSDRAVLQVGGSLSGGGDIDWYSFSLDAQKIQSIPGVNDSGRSGRRCSTSTMPTAWSGPTRTSGCSTRPAS